LSFFTEKRTKNCRKYLLELKGVSIPLHCINSHNEQISDLIVQVRNLKFIA